MIEIPVNTSLTSQNVTLIDDEDYSLVSQYKWGVSGIRKNGRLWLYVQGWSYALRQKHVYLHRLILGAKKGQVVDHINGDRFDNRRSNLRICTLAENARNRIKHCATNKYKGVGAVIRDKGMGYKASIFHSGKYYWLGIFDNEIEAARAYDAAAIRLHGEFALLNFPHEKNLHEIGHTSNYKFPETSCMEAK